MVVTVVLSGVPKYVKLVDLAICIDKFLNTNEVGTFVARELPNHSRTRKRQVALDFKDSYHAMEAQNILNKYQYKLPEDDKEYTLSAKVTNEPALMASPTGYGNELVPYKSRASTSHYGYEEELQKLKERLMMVETEQELIKAQKRLKRFKRKLQEKHYESESDSDSGARRKKKKKRKKRCRRSSTSSMSPSTPAHLAIESKAWSKETAVVPFSKSSSGHESERKISPGRYLDTPPPLRRSRWDTFEEVNVLRKSPSVETLKMESRKSKRKREKSVEMEKSKKKAKRDKSSERRSKRDRSGDKRSKREKSVDKRYKRDKSVDKRYRRDSVDRRSRSSSTSDSGDGRYKSPRKGRRSSTSRHKRRSPASSPSSRNRSVSGSTRRYDSPKYYRRSPSRRKSPSRRRSRSRGRSRSRRRRSPSCGSSASGRSGSPSPHHAARRSPSYRDPRPPSPPRYKREPDYRDYYRDDYEDAYKGISNKGVADSRVVYVPRDQNRYSSRPPATVTEITDGEDGEILPEGSDSLVEEEEEASPSRINLMLNVIERKNDPEQDLEEDRSHIKRIKTEIDKVKSDRKKSKKMPLPMYLDSTGHIKKEKRSDREKHRECDDDIRRAMPRPIKQEYYDVSEIIKIESEEEAPKPPKRISKNPRFVMPVNKIIKKMNRHIKDLPEELKHKFLGLMRKILRLRIKELLEGQTEYMPTAAIIALYRDNYIMDQDAGLVQKVLDDMKEGLFDDFVPSDEEEESPKKKVPEDPKLFEPYLAGKKKKTVPNKMEDENKENVLSKYTSNSQDDDVVVLEKNVDVIDITDVEEGKIKKEIESEPPADVDSDVICVDSDEDTVPKVKREMDNANVSVKTEERESDVPQVSIGETIRTNVINIKTEVCKGTEDGILLPDTPNIKTEIVEAIPTVVSVKTEHSDDGCVGLNSNEDCITADSSLVDITSALDDILASVKSEASEFENESEEIKEGDKSHENNKTVNEKPEQQVQVNKKDLINDILKISDEKLKKSNPSHNKDIDPAAAQINAGSQKEQTGTAVKQEVFVPEESLESIENFVSLVTTVIDVE